MLFNFSFHFCILKYKNQQEKHQSPALIQKTLPIQHITEDRKVCSIFVRLNKKCKQWILKFNLNIKILLHAIKYLFQVRYIQPDTITLKGCPMKHLAYARTSTVKTPPLYTRDPSSGPCSKCNIKRTWTQQLLAKPNSYTLAWGMKGVGSGSFAVVLI